MVAALLAGLTAAPVLTADAAPAPINVGKFRSWMAVMLQESGDKFCYVHGVPVRKRGNDRDRGASYVQVVQLPLSTESHTDELMYTAGYRFRPDSAVTLNIDGKRFRLMTREDTAWTEDVTVDPDLVNAMKKGRRMVVRGVADSGAATVDTYSLVGFTAAYRAAAEACGTK